MPRYVVKIIKFRCIDESGIDWTGSDEPMWVFTANAGGEISTTHSREFGDVDSGDTVKFRADNDRNTVWPSGGNTTGADGPIALSIQLWEKDQGDVATIAKKTEQLLDVAGAVPPLGQWISAVRGVVRGQLVDLFADDLMGSKTLLWPTSRLTRQLPGPGSSFTERHHFGGHSGDLPFEIAGGPDYDLYLQVTRLS